MRQTANAVTLIRKIMDALREQYTLSNILESLVESIEFNKVESPPNNLKCHSEHLAELHEKYLDILNEAAIKIRNKL